ncbi:hypothetical protein NDU88_003930 [Pleurodeles waltl]|uniref:Uncharacterized protein n=1 Tax=Pleurodeles waltl TaxID=8319 RepID=A0AAV7NR43_PLEWA|nr:hypothetical protein NDU88_003930 [Pleurodeles waltl]
MGPLLLVWSPRRRPLLANVLLLPTGGQMRYAKYKGIKGRGDSATEILRRRPLAQSVLPAPFQVHNLLFGVRGEPPQVTPALHCHFCMPRRGGTAPPPTAKSRILTPIRWEENSHRSLLLPPRRVRAVSSSAPTFYQYFFTALGPARVAIRLVTFRPGLTARADAGPSPTALQPDDSVNAEEGSGLPLFTGSPRFPGLEDREVLPLSLAVLCSLLLRPLPASLPPGDSGPPPPTPGVSPRDRYQRHPWRSTVAARCSPCLAATRVPGADVSAGAEESSGWAPLTGSPHCLGPGGREAPLLSPPVLCSPLLRLRCWLQMSRDHSCWPQGGPRETGISVLRGAPQPQATIHGASRLPESPARSRGLRTRHQRRAFQV